MDPSPAQLAESIKKNIKTCGILKIWGGDVFRPGDFMYEIADARADGEILKISLFHRPDGSKEQLEIERPAKAKVAAGSLRIAGAARITGFGRDFDARSKGPALLLE